MIITASSFSLAVGFLFFGTVAAFCAEKNEWPQYLQKKLPEFGHRNWIVIADSAYPEQSNPGIETIYVGGDQLEVVEKVVQLLGEQKHVRPTIMLDEEMEALEEKDAPGISDYRNKLKKLCEGKSTTLEHEKIIAQLDESAKVFKIIILKTDMTIPYTSVFIQLNCGYWGDAQEKALREKLKSMKK